MLSRSGFFFSEIHVQQLSIIENIESIEPEKHDDKFYKIINLFEESVRDILSTFKEFKT